MIPTISTVFPDFVAELERLLAREGRLDLSEQLARLPVSDRCRCGEDSCSHFYTAPKPIGSYGSDHENLIVPTERGLVVLDLVNGAIVAIEVLDRRTSKFCSIDSCHPQVKRNRPAMDGLRGG